jgi:hypothetical protein
MLHPEGVSPFRASSRVSMSSTLRSVQALFGPLVFAGLGLTGLLCSPGTEHGAAYAKINIGKSLNKAGKSVTKAANDVADAGKDAGNKVSDAWGDVASSTKKECDSIAKTAQKTYASTKGELEKAYQDAANQAQKILTAAQLHLKQNLAKGTMQVSSQAGRRTWVPRAGSSSPRVLTPQR